MAKTVKRAYRYRFYPSPEQETELLRTFGCVRKVWNLALDARTEAWYRRRERVTYVQSSAMLALAGVRLPQRGLVGPAAAGAPASSGRVRVVLGQAGEIPAFQVAPHVPAV